MSQDRGGPAPTSGPRPRYRLGGVPGQPWEWVPLCTQVIDDKTELSRGGELKAILPAQALYPVVPATPTNLPIDPPVGEKDLESL